MKQTEIAKILNITPATVSNCLNSTLGKEKLSEMRGERDEHYVKINEEIKKLTLKALQTYHQLFDRQGVDDKLKKETADTITLDIAGMRLLPKLILVHFICTLLLRKLKSSRNVGLKLHMKLV